MKSSKRAGPRARSMHTMVLAVVVALSLLLPLPAAWAVEIPTPTSIDMRILVIHTDADYVPGVAPDAFTDDDPELEGIVDALDRMGVPYDLLDARTEDLTPGMLFDETGHGNYYGVILTSGNLIYDAGGGSFPSGFVADEWSLLASYESTFGVRQVNAVAPQWGPDDYGVTFDGEGPTGDSGFVGTLTTDGAAVFADLRSDVQLPIDNTWVYYASDGGAAADITPLIVDGAGHTLAFTSTYGDPYPRETLSIMWVKNWYSLHSLLVWGGIIDWVTQGVHLGARHVNFSPQIDDLLIPDDIWDPGALSDQTGLTYRITNSDVNVLVSWQRGLGRSPLTADIRLEMAFNGEGAEIVEHGKKDQLTMTVMKRNDAFTWVNHTFSHMNLDEVSYDQALTDIAANGPIAEALGFGDNYDASAFVQPDISGLDNLAFLEAAADGGIKYLISDTSRISEPQWLNPTPNTGIVHPLESRLLVIPRRPSNLFYNLSTPDEWVSEYNYYYGPGGVWCTGNEEAPCPGDPFTYAEIIDAESDYLLGLLLRWDIDPLMFHQANLRNYANGQSLLTDVFDAAFQKYGSYYVLPIRSLTQAAIGEEMLARMAVEDAEVTATLSVPCGSVAFSADREVSITVTGVTDDVSSTESYGGFAISKIDLSGGVPSSHAISCEG